MDKEGPKQHICSHVIISIYDPMGRLTLDIKATPSSPSPSPSPSTLSLTWSDPFCRPSSIKILQDQEETIERKSKATMILSVLIFNNFGLPRLSKFYTPTAPIQQKKLISRIYALVENRPAGMCSFLDAPELRDGFFGGSAKGKEKEREGDEEDGKDIRVIYRQFATLTFVFTCDTAESELGVLDLIQVFVEALDKVFENVCELDLVFGFDEVHHTLAEIIQGGLVLETNINTITQNVTTKSILRQQSQDNPMASLSSLSTSAAGGRGRGRSRGPGSSTAGGILGSGIRPLGGVGGTAVAEWAAGLVGGWGSRRG